jgi:3-oxoacyl-[acyl-carrier protein] reductase
MSSTFRFGATARRAAQQLRVDLVTRKRAAEIAFRIMSFDSQNSHQPPDACAGTNTKGAFFTLQKAAKYVSDNGRIIYIGSSTTAFPMPGHGLYGSSKMAPRFLVEVLAKELGARHNG